MSDIHHNTQHNTTRPKRKQRKTQETTEPPSPTLLPDITLEQLATFTSITIALPNFLIPLDANTSLEIQLLQLLTLFHGHRNGGACTYDSNLWDLQGGQNHDSFLKLRDADVYFDMVLRNNLAARGFNNPLIISIYALFILCAIPLHRAVNSPLLLSHNWDSFFTYQSRRAYFVLWHCKQEFPPCLANSGVLYRGRVAKAFATEALRKMECPGVVEELLRIHDLRVPGRGGDYLDWGFDGLLQGWPDDFLEG